MPAYARRDIVNDDQVGVYHCIARCVRRAFLCGVDPYTGRDYNHRKEWVINRLPQLTGVFGVEACKGKSDTYRICSGKSDAGKSDTDTGKPRHRHREARHRHREVGHPRVGHAAKFVREFATDAGGCHAGSRRWRAGDLRVHQAAADMNSSAVLLGFRFEREHRPDRRMAFGALRDVRPITVPRNRSVCERWAR